MTWKDDLVTLNACQSARDAVDVHTLFTLAWEAHERADEMAWLLLARSTDAQLPDTISGLDTVVKNLGHPALPTYEDDGSTQEQMTDFIFNDFIKACKVDAAATEDVDEEDLTAEQYEDQSGKHAIEMRKQFPVEDILAIMLWDDDSSEEEGEPPDE